MAKNLDAPDWGERFLEALASGLGVNAAAAAAGIVKATAYNRRRADPEFRRRWDDARAKGSGKPRRPADVAVEALQTIATDETKADSIRIAAARELRVAERFAARPEDEEGSAGGQEVLAEESVSEETRKTLREAATAAWVMTLTSTVYLPPGLEWSRNEWAAFAELERADQETVLAEARDPRPMTPKGEDGARGAMVKASPAPAAVIERIERIILAAGDVLDV
jgi:hypothetical protein